MRSHSIYKMNRLQSELHIIIDDWSNQGNVDMLRMDWSASLGLVGKNYNIETSHISNSRIRGI